MASDIGKTSQPESQKEAGVKRRGLLRFGTLITALTSASAMSAISVNGAEAATGDKNPSAAYVPIAEKGAPSGVATLDATSKILPAQLPDFSSNFATTLIESVAGYPPRPKSAAVTVFVGATNPEALMHESDIWVNVAAPPALQLTEVATSIYNPGTALHLAVGSAAARQVATAIHIAPDDFAGISGSPSWAFTGSNAFTRYRGVLLDHASSETVGTFIAIPPGWLKARVKLMFTTLASTGGDVRWEVGYTKMVDGQDLTAGYTNPGTGVWSAPSANIMKIATFSGTMTVTGGDNLIIRVTRQAADPTDTHSGDAVLVGLVLERVE